MPQEKHKSQVVRFASCWYHERLGDKEKTYGKQRGAVNVPFIQFWDAMFCFFVQRLFDVVDCVGTDCVALAVLNHFHGQVVEGYCSNILYSK